MQYARLPHLIRPATWFSTVVSRAAVDSAAAADRRGELKKNSVPLSKVLPPRHGESEEAAVSTVPAETAIHHVNGHVVLWFFPHGSARFPGHSNRLKRARWRVGRCPESGTLQPWQATTGKIAGLKLGQRCQEIGILEWRTSTCPIRAPRLPFRVISRAWRIRATVAVVQVQPHVRGWRRRSGPRERTGLARTLQALPLLRSAPRGTSLPAATPISAMPSLAACIRRSCGWYA